MATAKKSAATKAKSAKTAEEPTKTAAKKSAKAAEKPAKAAAKKPAKAAPVEKTVSAVAEMPRFNGGSLYTFDVFIVDGPLEDKFIKKNKVLQRTIQLRGDQTLEDLHGAIFDAFGREDEHLYEFQIGGKGPNDPDARRYVLPDELEEDFGSSKPTGTVEIRIDAVGFKVDEAFGYWFDFGDDWWHQINVIEIADKIPAGKYPKVIKKVGANPPQYPEID